MAIFSLPKKDNGNKVAYSTKIPFSNRAGMYPCAEVLTEIHMETIATKRWPVITGLLLAVVGVITPMLWDILRSTLALELKQTGRTILIQRNDDFEKLRVDYDGKPVKELASIRFTLANTGSKPIRDTDLVSPPTLHFGPSNSILDVRIEDSFPPNLAASITKNTKAEDVSLSFPLLNPGDNIQFVILVGQVTPITFRADARIVGLSQLKVTTQVEEPAPTKKRTSWTVYAVGIFSFLCLIAVFMGLADIPKEVLFKKKVQEGELILPRKLQKEAALKHANSVLSWTSPRERSGVVSFIKSFPPEKILDDSESERLESLMRACSSSAMSNVPMVGIVGLIAIIGIAYVIIQIL